MYKKIALSVSFALLALMPHKSIAMADAEDTSLNPKASAFTIAGTLMLAKTWDLFKDLKGEYYIRGGLRRVF